MPTQKRLYFKLKLLSLVVIVGLGGLVVLVAGSFASPVVSAANPGCVTPKTKEEKQNANRAVDPECAKAGQITLTKAQAEAKGLKANTADDIIAKTLNGTYILVAIIAVIIIVLAGVRMITADGDTGKFTAARQTIVYATVGLAVVGSAFIITGVIQGIGTR